MVAVDGHAGRLRRGRRPASTCRAPGGRRARCRRTPSTPGSTTLGSPESTSMSFAESPGDGPAEAPVPGQRRPGGSTRSPSRSGLIRSVTLRARLDLRARGEQIVIQPPSSMPRSRASTGSISANISRLQLGQPRHPARHAACRVVLGERGTSWPRTGQRGSPMSATGLSGAVPAQRRRVLVDLRVERGSSPATRAARSASAAGRRAARRARTASRGRRPA